MRSQEGGVERRKEASEEAREGKFLLTRIVHLVRISGLSNKHESRAAPMPTSGVLPT